MHIKGLSDEIKRQRTEKQEKEKQVKKIAVVKGSIQSGGTSPQGKTKMRMLAVGDAFPAFSMTATVSTNLGKAFRTITDRDYPGKWKVYFFWPKDFTFVCPTEIIGFAELEKEFQDRNAQVLGGSIDSEFVHLAWRTHHNELRNLPFPLLADVQRHLCEALGILDRRAGVPQRATFIVDTEGVIRFVYVTDPAVGRNPHEVLRVLDALQSGELCPCNWKKGEPTLRAA